MMILVCGGRNYDDDHRAWEVLEEVVALADDPGSIAIVHGGCRGADQIAGAWARMKGFRVIECAADWTGEGAAAGPIRNAYMLDTHRPDYAVVFPGDRGTLDMLTRLFYARVPTRVVGR